MLLAIAISSILESISEFVDPNFLSTCSGEVNDSATEVPKAPKNPVLFMLAGSILAK